MLKDSLTLEIEEILSHYDLGRLAGLERNERGFVNTSFAIETVSGAGQGKYFLRKYKRGIREEEIQFEHSLIDHLVAEKSPPVARLHRTRAGKTYLQRFEGPGDQEGSFYAIFDFLPGEDRYTWVGPNCPDVELGESAAVLAQFHDAASRLKPEGRRVEPKILELLPVIAQNAASCLQKSKNTLFDACLIENLPQLRQNLAETMARLARAEAQSLPEVIVHCDFHPGNLKFEAGHVVGLFDFDWSKVDKRCFDVGLALWYFCASWEGERDGELRLGQLRTFLGAYQEALRGRPGLGPLSAVEGRFLGAMISASNLYIFNWTIDDYYRKEVDPQEYLVYLRHSLNFSRWFQDPANRSRLEETIVSALPGVPPSA
jgi:homoserine kinase type II